jgi:penicillin-binding protein 1A
MSAARARRAWNWLAAALLIGFLAFAGWSIWWVSRHAIAVHRLTRGVGDTMFYGADGRPWFRLDEQRRDVALGDIAADLRDAVVAVEDRRFRLHPGVDPIGIVRAVVRDIRAGGRVEGGSTLTQQLARTLFLSNARTFNRKAKEAALAFLIEIELTKPQILELYLNRVYLSAGVYGVEAMSQHLFRKPAKALTLAESALIAGLIRAPSALSPWSNYDGALERSHVVLSVMREQGLITADEEAAARRSRPRVQPYRSPRDPRGAWAKEFLRQQFRNEFGGDHPPDWRVDTTFRPAIQDAAERAVAAGVKRLNRPGLEAALVAIEPLTGNLVALVGGADYTRSTFNRATRARRQPGSAFKPLVYAAALENGFSPVSVLTDLEKMTVPGNPEWLLASATDEQPVELTLRGALIESNNAAAAALQQKVSTRTVRRLASDAGLGDLPDVASLALGTGLVTPLDLTAAYTMFPGAGQVVRPRGLVSAFDANGEQILDRPVERTPVVSAAVSFQMVSMLRDVVDRGTGRAVRAAGLRIPVGGKTGTTDDYRDAWFVGFSNKIVVGVWVGFDQPSAIGPEAYAARIAVPIWADFMKRTADTFPASEFVVPASVDGHELCSVSYLKPVDGCPTYIEYLKEGDDVPSRLCQVHSGSLKQRATRAVQGLLRTIGRSITDIFRR